MKALLVGILVACVVVSALASTPVVNLGERNSKSRSFRKFDDVVGHKKPTIVFFYLPGCAHCRGFQPEFREASHHFEKDDVIFARVDVDRWDELAKEYGVDRVPDIRFCPAGQRGAACQTYPEYSPNTASGVIDWLSGKVGSRFLQNTADTETRSDTEVTAEVAATKGTCPVIHHDTTSFAQIHAEEEEVEAELDEEESELDIEEEAEEAVDAEEETEAEEEVEAEGDSEEETEAEAEEESDNEADEEIDEEVDEEAEEEDALDEDADDEEAADAHAESEEEVSAFLEVAHSEIDEAMAAFREENDN